MVTADALEVLFEDAHVLAVCKPAGLLTQGVAGGGPTLEDAARRHLDPASPGAVYLGTVHRLDRPVSGVVVWAKTPKAARRLAGQFEARTTVKEYLAVVDPAAGVSPPSPDSGGVWEDWLAAHTDGSGVVRVVDGGAPGARRAVTRFRAESPAIDAPAGLAALPWLRLWPETGRTHQLRAQAARRGLPVLGDAAYGSARPFERGVALHAVRLTFEHPTLGSPTTVVAPVPPSWRVGRGVGG